MAQDLTRLRRCSRYQAPMWRERPLPQPATFIEPCLPRPPSSRLRATAGYTRSSTTGSASWPAGPMAASMAVVCDENGLAVFDLIRGYRHDTAAVLCAFDLLEVDGKDLRREPDRGTQGHPRETTEPPP
jgi:hypothetical protein